METNRLIKVTSPLADELVFASMTASERLGRMFQFDVELLSRDPNVDFSAVLGQGFTVCLETGAGDLRYYNGLASRFSHVGYAGRYCIYRATLRPWLWLLTRTSNCRIFQELSVPDIIKQVFRDHGLTDFKESLTGSYQPREYCVQYRETDFNFVSRLMEEEGIYYYFEHEADKHTLVLADSYSSHNTVSGYEEIPYYPPDELGRRGEDHLRDWSVEQEVQPGSVVLDDFDFEKPKADLQANSSVSRSHSEADYEIYDYPGEYKDSGAGGTYARTRMEEFQSQHEVASAEGDVCMVGAGNLFSLTQCLRDDQNREYLIQEAVHVLRINAYESTPGDSGSEYSIRFSAIDSQQSFRPQRSTPIPTVKGPQTAMVVGKKGEEIWTDKHGRVKVQFHWDREGKSDENSSCWVRVAQIWAGKAWGAIHIPRIGQEVIVEFLEGDPDRPIVTGRVYNGDNKPPYSLPDNQTQSGILSRSTKKGAADNFNEIRFEDKKGEEQVYFHAEKDFQRVVENDDSLEVGNDQTIEVKKNRKRTVTEGNEDLIISKGNRTVLVDTGNDEHTVSKGNRSVEISMGNDDLKIKMGNQTTKIDIGKSSTQAMQAIELKVGGNSIKIDQSGVTIKGIMVKIEGNAMAELKAAMVKVEGSGMLQAKGGITMIG